MFINIRFRKDKKVISYNKLWHQIIDKNLKKSDLCAKSGISSSTLAKLSKMSQYQSMYLKEYVMH